MATPAPSSSSPQRRMGEGGGLGVSSPRPLPSTPTAQAGPAYLTSASTQKIRVTIIGARSLAKRDLFRMPDPFVRVTVDPGGSGGVPASPSAWTSGTSCVGQTHCSETSRNTVDPKWNAHYDLILRPNDAITISVWNEKKVRT